MSLDKTSSSLRFWNIPVLLRKVLCFSLCESTHFFEHDANVDHLGGIKCHSALLL